MNTIKLNNTTFTVESYNKNTVYDGTNITSNGYFNIINPTISAVNALVSSPIESIQIHHDGTLIYDLDNINARISSINEYLNNDRVDVGINLVFDIE